MHTKSSFSLIRKTLNGIAVLAIFLFSFVPANMPTAQAQGVPQETPNGVVVNLSADKSSFGGSEDVILHVRITNPADRPIRMLKWLVPAQDMGAPLFVVTRDGKPVAYIGKMVMRSAPTEQDYITLGPGAGITADVDLSMYYDLSVSGSYSVAYKSPLSGGDAVAENELASNHSGRANSNVLDLFIESHAVPAPKELQPLVVNGSNSFSGCSASQQTSLIDARNSADTYASDAVSYFGANKLGRRYITWFGAYEAARYSTVSNHFSSIKNAASSAAMTFDCTCTYAGFVAYVYPDSPYTIYLCPPFWPLPLSGQDSKAGVLIHEISHFTVVAGTDDYAYGHNDVKSLAIDNPAQAILNASSFEYFAENDPPLETTTEYTIWGNAGVGAATLTYTGGSATAGSGGNYSIIVAPGWSGTVTPSRPGYTFSPANRTYSNVLANQTSQNYTTPTRPPILNGDFEEGPFVGWNEYSSSGWEVVSYSGSGNWDASLGKSNNTTSYISQSGITIANPVNLRLLYRIDSFDDICGYDYGYVQINSSTIYTWNLCSANNTNDWVPLEINLNAYVGQTITLTVMAVNDSRDSGSAHNSFLYIDDVSMVETSRTISGNVGASGVTLGYTEGTPKSVTSDSGGNYSIKVPLGWSGTVTPTHTCYTFNPLSRTFNNVTANQAGQNFTATFNPASGCANINISISGANRGTYGLPTGESTRQSYVNINSGPVKLDSTNAVPLIAAERVIYTINGVRTSFSEMMALPNSQLNTTYWLPWYNNVDLDTQLRIGNVSGSTATVHVYIGDVEMLGSPFTLSASGDGQSTRVSFAGINSGPVRIVSNVPIVAAERVIYTINGVRTSFSEMMALPNSQLNTTYWLPWYNNVDLDTQLRFGVP